ncbi:MAG: pilus assembly FimT family protein [Vicinamibacterales bacterium]
MRPLPTNRHAQFRTVNGFTLLEIVVTLVLLGLAATLVAPVFRRDTSPDGDVNAIVASARESAVRRAQTLMLRVDDRGAWRLTPIGDTTSIGAGFLSENATALTLRISPLGACFNEGSAPAAQNWDAIACTSRRVAPR